MSEYAPPPMAPSRPIFHERFGTNWTDAYAWLRDPAYPEVTDPEIRAYLEAENGHFEAFMAPHGPLVDRLHAELKGRIKADDSSVPAREGAFEYHWRFFEGAQYRTWFRRGLDEAEPVVILDETLLAAGKGYFSLRSLDVSPDGRLLAYSTDEDGSERFRLHLRNLVTGEELADLVANTSGARRVGRGRPDAALCRAQRQPAAVPGPRPSAGRRPGRRRHPLRGGRPGVLRVDRQDPQPRLPADRHRHPRHARALSARRRRPAGAATAGGARGGTATATGSTMRTAVFGSSPTTGTRTSAWSARPSRRPRRRTGARRSPATITTICWG